MALAGRVTKALAGRDTIKNKTSTMDMRGAPRMSPSLRASEYALSNRYAGMGSRSASSPTHVGPR
jgi:hypothetical protein